MVAGGIETFVERAKATLLDYAIWTAAYDNIRAGNLEWMYRNIGLSADIGTFDIALVQEDFAYPLAAAILLPALWDLPRRADRPRGPRP